jgi:hypothetical protein
MPAVDGHKSHRFDSSRDLAMLRNALELRVEMAGAEVQVILRSRGVGHAFPTGDLFRRLRVRVLGLDEADVPLWDEERTVSRRFNRASGQRREIADERLFGQRVLFVPMPAQANQVRVLVYYERVAQLQDSDGVSAPRASVFSSDVIAETQVPVTRVPKHASTAP